MSSTSPRREFWRGMRDTAPFAIVIIPFAMLFGVVATEAGLNLLEIMAMSATVLAGAAQFTALGLMQENAPTIIVLISALAVNMRMAMYSASLVPHFGEASLLKRATAAYILVDQPYALSITRYEDNPDLTMSEKFAFYWGCSAFVIPLWFIMTYVGASIGKSLPEWIPLDFAVPITFLAVIAPMLRTRAHVVAALAAIVAALLFAWLPFNLGLIVGGLCGMMAGAEAERRGIA